MGAGQKPPPAAASSFQSGPRTSGTVQRSPYLKFSTSMILRVSRSMRFSLTFVVFGFNHFAENGTRRARSRSIPALPYIWRLIVLSRFTWPSTGPLLHFWRIAASTAGRSCRRVRANYFKEWSPEAVARSNQPRSVLTVPFCSIPWKLSAIVRIAAKPGQFFFN
jgi:hypothetical protein